MKDLKITKGEWEVNHDAIANDITELAEHITIVANDWHIACVFTDITNEGDEEKNNAALIADAGNTAQKCGLLPSELLMQRDELLKALHEIMMLPESTGHAYKMKDIAQSAITKAEER